MDKKNPTKEWAGSFVVNGGGGRDRTGVNGFAGRCITTLLPRHGPYCNREIENTLHNN